MQSKRRKAARPVIRRRRKRPQPESTAIVVRPPEPIVRAASIIPKIKETLENQERVRRFISRCLNVDLQRAEAEAKTRGKELDKDVRKRLEIDWGTIPGVDKPFLMQPGAEKFLFWLSLRPKFIKQEQDLGDGHLEVICRVVLFAKKTNEEVFEGPDCSCSTMETNYRYIWAESERVPDEDEKERLKAIGMGKMKKVPEWKGGRKVGERWAWFVRIDNPNIHNERNKVRQIGQKRALVKCVRNMGAISAIFNSDPSEWNVDPDEDSYEADVDYTEGGRRIVIDGVSPSGKYVSPEAQRAAAKKNAEDVVRRLKDDAAHGHPQGSAAAKQAEAQLNKVEQADRELKKAKPTVEDEERKAIQSEGRKKLQPVSEPAVQDAWPKNAEPEKPAEPTLLKGAIERTTAGMTSRHQPILNVKVGGAWYVSYRNTIFQYISGKDGFVIEATLDKNKTITGLIRVGKQQFDADGATPFISRDREPGSTKNMFEK